MRKEIFSALVHSESKEAWKEMCDKFVSKSDKSKVFLTQADLFKKVLENFRVPECQE